MTVYDENGNPVEIDGNVCPPGHSVRAPLAFLDAEQRQVFADSRREEDEEDGDDDADNPYPITDEMVQRCEDAREAYKARISAGMHRRRVPTERPQHVPDGVSDAAVAYTLAKQRLGARWKTRRQRQPRSQRGQEL